MRVRLEYGKDGLEVELPDELSIRQLAYKQGVPLPDPAAALDRALLAPTGAKPLSEIAAGRRSACILICDITRPVPNQVILPPVLRTLEAAGINRQDGIGLNPGGRLERDLIVHSYLSRHDHGLGLTAALGQPTFCQQNV